MLCSEKYNLTRSLKRLPPRDESVTDEFLCGLAFPHDFDYPSLVDGAVNAFQDLHSGVGLPDLRKLVASHALPAEDSLRLLFRQEVMLRHENVLQNIER